jgi:hypothetical protein
MAYAKGKFAKAISDRSGHAFPYTEMKKEWNGSFVHKSEFESKHPQLDPIKHKGDAIALKDARPPVDLDPVPQMENGILNSLQKQLGHTAKSFPSTFKSDNAVPKATALTLSASLGNESVSVS